MSKDGLNWLLRVGWGEYIDVALCVSRVWLGVRATVFAGIQLTIRRSDQHRCADTTLNTRLTNIKPF